MSDAAIPAYLTPPPEPVCNSPPTTDSGHTGSTDYYYISSEGRRVYPDISSLTPYKLLPEGWDESEHHWLYGWPASQRKLQALLPKYFGVHLLHRSPSIDAGNATSILEHLSGYWHINWLIWRPTEETQKEGIVEDISGLGVPFLIISCTAGSRLFKRQPTVKQLRFLTRILGEPRWLESRYPKNDFSFDLMC